MTPTLVLTRPEAQSHDFVAGLGVKARVIVSPVMRIEAVGEGPDLGAYGGLIFTSANAVTDIPDLAGIPTYCVGTRTASAAKAAGADVRLVARNADDLVARLSAEGPLLHLRGEHTRGEIAERLNSAGIETYSIVIYRQVALPLSTEARAAVEGEAPVVLPLFSPRSARLVGEQVRSVGRLVRAIAMSPAVAGAWREATGASAEILSAPTGEAMRDRVLAALRG